MIASGQDHSLATITSGGAIVVYRRSVSVTNAVVGPSATTYGSSGGEESLVTTNDYRRTAITEVQHATEAEKLVENQRGQNYLGKSKGSELFKRGKIVLTPFLPQDELRQLGIEAVTPGTTISELLNGR